MNCEVAVCGVFTLIAARRWSVERVRVAAKISPTLRLASFQIWEDVAREITINVICLIFRDLYRNTKHSTVYISDTVIDEQEVRVNNVRVHSKV